MNITIKEKKENNTLSRMEYVIELFFEQATPNRKEIQKAIAKDLKSNEKTTVIKRIGTKFGASKADVIVFVYNNEEVMHKLERKNLVEKHAGHEPKKTEEAN